MPGTDMILLLGAAGLVVLAGGDGVPNPRVRSSAGIVDGAPFAGDALVGDDGLNKAPGTGSVLTCVEPLLGFGLAATTAAGPASVKVVENVAPGDAPAFDLVVAAGAASTIRIGSSAELLVVVENDVAGELVRGAGEALISLRIVPLVESLLSPVVVGAVTMGGSVVAATAEFVEAALGSVAVALGGW